MKFASVCMSCRTLTMLLAPVINIVLLASLCLITVTTGELPSFCLTSLTTSSSEQCCRPQPFLEVSFKLRFGCDVPHHIDEGVRLEIKTAGGAWQPVRYYTPTLDASSRESTPIVRVNEDNVTVEAQALSYTSVFPLEVVEGNQTLLIREYICDDSFLSSSVSIRWMQRYNDTSMRDVSTWLLDDVEIIVWNGECRHVVLNLTFDDNTAISDEGRYSLLAGNVEIPACDSTGNSQLHFNQEGNSRVTARRSITISDLPTAVSSIDCPIGSMSKPGSGLCDVEECSSGNNVCSMGALQCTECFGLGYQPPADNSIGSCLDIDECKSSLDNCEQFCNNVPGSFENITECVETSFCFHDQLCTNTNGSYQCTCKDGFASLPDNTTCICPAPGMCPALPDLLNGRIEYSEEGSPGFLDRAVATHICNSGYLLNGSSPRTCEVAEMSSTGEFDGEAPVCDPVCDQLPDIANGVISYSPDKGTPYSVATVATYSCNEGYELTGPGNEMRTCRDNGDGSGGDFDGTAPTCESVCDQLSAIANGTIFYAPDMVAPYSVATVATYSCNEGYILRMGDETRTCRDNGDGSGGDFDGTAPTCEPVCDQLSAIANGTIFYSPDMVAPYSVATVATYSCNEGYILRMGDEMRTCRDNGDGSGGDFDGTAPTCEPQCPPLPAIMNGTISYGPDSTPDYDVGTVATYVCDEGFLLIGNLTRECQSDRSFLETEPMCSLILVCEELELLVNGRIEYSPDTVAPYDEGTEATHICSPGFSLVGGVIRVCQNDSNFNGTPPICQPVECPPLPPIANGVITYAPDTVANYSLGTNASYDCNAGFSLVGPSKRTCRDANGMDTIGRFSDETPSCMGITVCSAGEYQGYSWPDTRQGLAATAPCPCEEELGDLAGEVTRQCSQSPLRAVSEWSPELDFSNCKINNSQVFQKLCEITMGNQIAEAAEQLVNITSQTSLTSNEVVLVTTVLEATVSMAATNPKVRDNYLQTIDNIQQFDPDVLMESQRTMNSTTRILTSLETLLDTLDLNSTAQNSTTNRTTLTFNTFAVQVEDIDVDDFTGQTFIVALGSVEQARTASGRIDQEALITMDGVTNTGNDSNTTTSFVQLTPDFFKACMNNVSETNSTSQVVSQRLSYSVFLVNSLFQSPENRTVGSIIVTARTNCQLPNNTLLPVPARASFQVNDTVTWNPDNALFSQDKSINSSCAVYNNKDGFGAWNSDGCREISRAGRNIGCECTQLGHFGILLDLNPSPLPEDLSIAVSTITFVGLGLSLICLGLFIFTYLVSKKLQANPHNGIVLHLCISLGGLYIAFLLGGFPTKIPPLCGVMSALIHYFFLVYFAWTAVEAVWLYLKLVKVFGSESLTSRYALKAGVPAWTLPIVIVAISAGAGRHYYVSHYYCRPTEWPFFFGLILPFLAVYVFNWIMFFATMISVCKHTQNSKEIDETNRQEVKKILIIAMCLAVTLGLGWGLGLVATSSDYVALTFAFQVIFSIFVGLQGVLIFVFYGLRNTDFWDCWKSLCVKPKSQSFTDSNTTKFSPISPIARDSNAHSLPWKVSSV